MVHTLLLVMIFLHVNLKYACIQNWGTRDSKQNTDLELHSFS